MNPLIIIYMIVSIIFAIGSLVYVAGDIVVEIIAKAMNGRVVPKVEEPEPLMVEPEPIPEPEPEPIPEPEPEIVEHIDAEEADALMTDGDAMKKANYESGAGSGKQGIINIGLIDAHFEAGDLVTLAILKEKGLMSKKIGRMKILADGVLNKPLIIKSESYSVQAIKMIELTGGTVIILKD